MGVEAGMGNEKVTPWRIGDGAGIGVVDHTVCGQLAGRSGLKCNRDADGIRRLQ